MLDRAFYNTVLSQAYSPCGRYLVAGNTYGELAVFDLDRSIAPSEVTVDYNKPKRIHIIDSNSQICSLVSSEQFLIIGTTGELIGWNWKNVTSSKPFKAAWKIQLPSNKSVIEQRDVNSLWLDKENTTLYAGCGDNNMYAFHLEDGRLLRTYEGHTDFIHSVNGKGDIIISTGEDGSVKLWDPRSARCSHTLEPHTHEHLARADLGKWVGAADMSDDWIVCGGGPRLSLWSLRSLEPISTYPLPDQGIHVSFFTNESIIAAGAAPHLYKLNMSGDVSVEMPVSATTVYSAMVRQEPFLMSVAGSSDEIDVCTTLKYVDTTLQWSQ